MISLSLKFKKKHLIDYAILTLSLLQVFFLNWLNINLTAVIAILITISILLRIKTYEKYTGVISGLILLSIYLVLNYLIKGGNLLLFMQNILKVLMRILIIIYYSYLICCKPEFISGVMIRLVWVFNSYAFLNIPVILFQLAGHYELAALGMNLTNFMKEDMVSGLFGLYGTPYMAVYYSFLFIYNNFFCSQVLRKGKHATYLMLYNICITVFACFISLTNDNKGFYIIFTSFILGYFIVETVRKNGSRGAINKILNILKKGGLIIVPIAIVFLVAYKFTPFQKTVYSWIRIFNNAMNENIIAGSSERFQMILYALKEPQIRWMGVGLGQYGWKQSNALGFLHFGQGDFGAFICLGGIVFIVIILRIIFIALLKIYKDRFLAVVTTLVMIFLMVFTAVLTGTSVVVSYMLFITICWMYGREF